VNLTQNFTLSEMTKSETALRFGMANDPTETEIENMRVLCEKVLQPVRNYYGMGVKVNSGYRHPLVNAKVGGSPQHQIIAKGLRRTSRFQGIANADLAEWIKDNCEFKQLILEFYTPGVPDSGWVHVSYDFSDLKKQVLTATKQNGKTVYLPGLVA
jgi:zinc D-Ala-D-Ala carboxypeptidase